MMYYHRQNRLTEENCSVLPHILHRFEQGELIAARVAEDCHSADAGDFVTAQVYPAAVGFDLGEGVF